MEGPAQRFVNAMSRLGLSPRLEAGLVIFRIVSAAGAHAGKPLDIGVSLEELTGWPQVPPHWIHLPADIRFATTNVAPSSKPGWNKHSRNSAGWGDAPPEVCWTSHIHAVLSEAIL